jgi:hypothetical protein
MRMLFLIPHGRYKVPALVREPSPVVAGAASPVPRPDVPLHEMGRHLGKLMAGVVPGMIMSNQRSPALPAPSIIEERP